MAKDLYRSRYREAQEKARRALANQQDASQADDESEVVMSERERRESEEEERVEL